MIKSSIQCFFLLTVFIAGNMACQRASVAHLKHSQPLSVVKDTNVILPPAWAFGYLYGSYTNQAQTLELVDQIIAHDYPIDAYWIDSWIWDWKNQGRGPAKYMDFVADTVSYPDRKKMWGYLQSKNIKGGMWMWDCIMQTGNEAAYQDFKSKGFFKSEPIRTDGWHNGSRTTIIGDNSKKVLGTRYGDIDFENPKAVVYFQQRVKHFFDEGVDFIKLDKTDAIPVVKAMFELSQQLGHETQARGFVLSHSHGVSSEEYKKYPGKWTDDTRSDWSAKSHTRKFSPWLPAVGLKENIAMYTDQTRHFHKIPFLANDMGGFAVSEDGFVDEELYIRWLEFATFVPLTTPFSQPENKTGNIAFKVSNRADSIFRSYAHLKMELFPYIYSYAHQSRLSGVNTIRPISGDLYTYHFGDEFLVAPVYEPAKTERTVILPKGVNWINYWTGQTVDGGQAVQTHASIGQIPLFVKAGSIIPMRPYARSIELGSNDTLRLHIYPGASGAFDLIEDDGKSNDYLKGQYSVTHIEQIPTKAGFDLLIHPAHGQYNGQHEDRHWELIVHDQQTYSTVKEGRRSVKSSFNNHQTVVSGILHSAWKPIRLSFIR